MGMGGSETPENVILIGGGLLCVLVGICITVPSAAFFFIK